VEELTEQAATLEAEGESKQKSVAALDERARDITAGYKPQMLERDNREKRLGPERRPALLGKIAARSVRIVSKQSAVIYRLSARSIRKLPMVCINRGPLF